MVGERLLRRLRYEFDLDEDQLDALRHELVDVKGWAVAEPTMCSPGRGPSQARRGPYRRRRLHSLLVPDPPLPKRSRGVSVVN